jgi:phospholipid/cholesterol/gamma-HCH transport system substrate-binding protein
VIIYEGTANTAAIEPGAYLSERKDSITNGDMIATLQQNNKNLVDITNNLRTITKKMAEGEGTIGKLNDATLSNTLQKTFNDFRTVALEGRRSIANIEDFTANMNKQNSSVNRLFADTAMFDSVKTTLTQLQSLTQTANEFANNMNTFATNLKTVSESLRDTTNVPGMLLYDKQTADSLQVIIKNLTSASKKLDEDLEATQHNFLLKGYFKKENKSTSSHN